MSIIFNKKQQMVIDDICSWWKSSKQIYEFGGYAGTGKSTVLLYAIERLGIPLHRTAAMAFIGQAAIIMRMKGLYNAKTIHSWLFNPVLKIKTTPDGSVLMDNYFNRPKMDIDFEPKPLDNIDLIIIDEGWTVPYWLRPHLESRNIKMLITGDPGQLPPVGDKPAFLTDIDNIIVLDEIMRQGSESGILYLADRARRGLPIHKGFYGDALVIDTNEITDRMILNSDVIICGKNKTRDDLNKRVRHLLGIRTDIPVLGEKLVCRKNNWTLEVDGINLANGLCGVVTNMPGVHSFDGKTFRINFRPNMLQESFIDIPCDYQYLISSYEKRQQLKNNKYSVGEKFEFAYAVTTHMSQGSQYFNGLFIEEFLSKEFHNNLVYTGITRFSNSMILAKQSKKYF